MELSWLRTAFCFGAIAVVGLDNAKGSPGTQAESSHRALDIVIAHYHPTAAHMLPLLMIVPAVAERRPHWILYNKNDKEEPQITRKMHFDEVINLPNVGREGQTFLHHMISRRDDLADHTIFCQEEPHGYENVLSRLRDYFNTSTGFLSLTTEIICTCEDCLGHLQPLKEVYELLTKRSCQDPFVAAFSGCFLVSRERINSVPHEHLEYIMELIEAPEDHHIHTRGDYVDTPVHLGSSSRSNPLFGHVLERLWSVIFNCSTEATPSTGSDHPAYCLDHPRSAEESVSLGK